MAAFFDSIYLVEELPSYPHNWQEQTTGETIIKATKVHAMSSAPFDMTIKLDFDSFPCQRDLKPLLETFNNDADADIGFSNVLNSMEYLTDSKHFLGEHNSAVVALNMTSIRTRLMLALYIQAFHQASEFAKVEKKKKKQRDHPALMIALQAMSEGFQRNKDQRLAEVPNDSVREVIEKYQLGFIRHVDLNQSQVCQKNTSDSQTCSEGSLCVISHKAENLYKQKREMKGRPWTPKKTLASASRKQAQRR